MKIIPEKTNTFCYYPFTQLSLKAWSNGAGIINAAPCCNSSRPETPDPLHNGTRIKQNKLTALEIFHSSDMDELRHALLNNTQHPACTTCWKMENNNLKSYRFNSSPPDPEDFDIDNPKLQCIDFGFGEHCNLRCRMCQPAASNKLRTDYNYFVKNNLDTTGIAGFDYKNDIKNKDMNYTFHTKENSHNETLYWDNGTQWEDILANIHLLKSIKATGGETTIAKPFLQFIDVAIETDNAKNIILEFHSNATKFTKTFIKKLLKFKYVRFNLSIDSTGKNYEYIRYPMKWDILNNSVNNLIDEFIEKEKMANIELTSVISILNAYDIPDLMKWWQSNFLKNENILTSFFYIDLLWPENKFINIKFLSREIKEELIEQFSSIENNRNTNITHISGYLKTHLNYQVTDTDRKNMLREVTLFDKVRNQSYKDYLNPKIIKFLETPIE